MTIAANNDTSVRLAVNWGEVKFLCASPKQFKNFITTILGDDFIESRVYLNKKQTCAFLGIDNNTLDKWIRIYNFPVIRVGGVVRFDVEDIKDFMNTFKIT
ncbi:TPA: helix-turn-helix domain-containing protein [Enterococcus faecium]